MPEDSVADALPDAALSDAVRADAVLPTAETGSGTMNLAGDFPACTAADWRELAAAVVNRGRPAEAALDPDAVPDRLRSELPGGLVVDPLYLRASDAPNLGLPAVMPFTRGRALRDVDLPWDVRQLHDDPDAARTREAVLDDLEHGVSSVWLQVGADGLAPGDLATALADVHLEMAAVVVSSWDAQPEAARALRAVIGETPEVTGYLGLDPLGAAARTGTRPDLTTLAPLVAELSGPPGLRALTVDVRPYRDAGATAVQELGYAVATGLAYARELVDAGYQPAIAFGHIEFRVSATADQFLTMAALRALRTMWARVAEVCAVPPAERGARIHAVTAWRMFTRDDPWVNVLRSTIATFAACAGGADAITVLPYDAAHGLPERFSRRLARNTQIVLAEEANIGRVTDPAGGAYVVEDLTAQLAASGWRLFQQIEAGGGMAAYLNNGDLARDIRQAADQANRELATRAQPLTGVSMFPLATEQPLPRRARPQLTNLGTDALLPHRDSAIFEDLRDRAAAYAAQHGEAPALTVLGLGGRREFGARESFVTNLLAVGGIRAAVVEEHDQVAAGQETVVIASSPKGYAAHGAAAVVNLRAAGVGTVLIAGRARELTGTAVDGELYDGMDVVAALGELLDRLGAPGQGGIR